MAAAIEAGATTVNIPDTVGYTVPSEFDRLFRYLRDHVAGIALGGRRIFLVHYPHYAAAMATTGDWDLVCCGHDHKAAIRAVDNMAGTRTWLVNPGTVGGIKAPATWVHPRPEQKRRA